MDNKLAMDESRRAMQHEAIKSEVESDVNSEIAARADQPTEGEAQRMDQVAGQFRSKAVNEVIETEREVGRSRAAARISQVIDFIFYIIYALLAIRLLLESMAARHSAGFTQLIFGLSNPLFAPFRGIVASPSAAGGYTLALPIVIALIVYALVHLGINALLRMVSHRKTAI